jgi:multiple sugar transport system substrate-binding protein
MRRLAPVLLIAAALATSSCTTGHPGKTEITLQRVFGTCDSEYGAIDDVSKAEGECGIITALVNQFEAENPDVRVRVNTVFWPGYDQLTAQLAANDEPDLVTMHSSVIPDYQARGLLEPVGDELAAAGVDPARFSEAARKAVTIDGRIWGLPFDTWSQLWHINLGEFRKAGLVRNGAPILPRDTAELLAQAEQFKRATGKPYFVQSMANEWAAYARNLYTGILQQNQTPFADTAKIRLHTPEAARVLALYKAMYDRNLTTKDLDYSAATSVFLNGGGGVFLTGTWMVSTFDAEAKDPARPLAKGYTVVPYPQLFPGRDASFVDGHNWVMPVDKRRTPQEKSATLRLMRFLADHDADWARTGHLPVFEDIIASPQFRALPHRASYARIAQTGFPLPSGVRRQYPIENILGEESAAAITGEKTIDRALADAERRINELLANI